MARVSAHLPADFEMAVHFNPSYNPWDQRVCLVPNGDLFKAVRDGDAEVVTGTIEAVTEGGTALSGSISTGFASLSWICVGIHSRRALPCPVCA